MLYRYRALPPAFGIFIIAILILFADTRASISEEPVRAETEEFDFANGLFSRGMFDLAVDVYKDFLKGYPSSEYAEQAYYRIAEAYFLSGKYVEAVNRFGDFTEKYPEGELSLKANLRKGQCYYFSGDTGSAGKVFNDLILKDGSGASGRGAMYYLAVLRMKDKDFKGARDILEKMLEKDDEGEYSSFAYLALGDAYRELGAADSALEAYSLSMETADTEKLRDQARLGKAAVLFGTGDLSRAAALYKETMISTGSAKYASRAAEGLFSSLYRMRDYGLVISELPLGMKYASEPESAAKVIFLGGNSYFQKDDLENALRTFNEASSRFPDTLHGRKAVLNACWTLYRLGRNDECVRRLDRYMSLPGADRDEALFLKSKALADTGKGQEAIELLSGLIVSSSSERLRKESLYEKAVLEESAGDRKAANTDLLAFAQKYPRDERSPAALLKAAQEMARDKEYEEASAIYDRFKTLYSDSELYEDVLFQSGRAYQQQGDNTRAVEAYKEFIEKYPLSKTLPAANYWLGRGYQSEEQWAKAVEVFSALLKDGNKDIRSSSLESLAFSYYEQGNEKEAAETYYRLMSEAPEKRLPESVYTWVADHYMLADDAGKALEVLEIYSSRAGDQEAGPGVVFLYGKALFTRGDHGEASGYFDKIIETGAPSPYLENSHACLGDIAYAQERYADALEHYNRALEVSADNASGARARMGIAGVHFKRMEFPEAAKQYMMVAILYEDDVITPEALFNAASSFAKAGDTSRAVELFKELSERYPDSEFSTLAGSELARIQDETR